tara:strand:+ start:311 stop:1726 length:1416 start_codon:yes stop_codon:yes gene_type:complete
MKKFKKIGIIILIIFGLFYLFINNSINNNNFYQLKNIINEDIKIFVKKYFFPYRTISENEKKIHELEKDLKNLNAFSQKVGAFVEVKFQESLKKITTKKEEDLKLDNNLVLSKYKLNDGFYFGINRTFPGSGYIDYHEENLIVISSRGILAVANFEKEINFTQIKNNIYEFININQFQKGNWFSLKDLKIHGNRILISYTEEIKKDCWNTSIISGYFNLKNVNFSKLFSADYCISGVGQKALFSNDVLSDPADRQFNAHQSGGRIVSFSDNEILFSIGDYRQRFHAQDINSVNGKIIKINIENGSYKIISMGHRNPQGLYFDRENNIILSTEHGPKGGDEINLIMPDSKIIPNYGWPIASYGEHYGEKSKNNHKYKKYPLIKPHKSKNFIEPLKYFVHSIGVSEIVKTKDKSYIASSLADKSIYFFSLDKDNQINNFKRIFVNERVRDMIFKNDKLYLFLEDTASIGIINL